MATTSPRTSETTRRRGRPPKKAPEAHAPRSRWHLDVDQLHALGQEMATAATQQVRSSGTYWERCRDQFIEAQTHGVAQQALEALFGAGDAVEGKKAPWYRTYKSLLTTSAQRGIILTADMGMSTVQKLIKEHKAAEIENDPHAKEVKDQQMLEMFRRLAQGCLNRGISKSDLAAVLKELQVTN